MTARDVVRVGWFLLGPAPKPPPPTTVEFVDTPVGVLRVETYTPHAA